MISNNQAYISFADIKISYTKRVIIVLYELVAGYIYFRAISTVVATRGSAYILFDATYARSAVGELGFLVNLFHKIANVLAYICLFDLLYNMLLKNGKFFSYLCDGLVILVWIFTVLISGSRGNVINFIVSAVFIYYVLYCKIRSWNVEAILKTLKQVTLLVFIVLLLFFVLLFVQNRGVDISANKTATSLFFDTTSAYIGAQIDLLDKFIMRDHLNIKYQFWGYESFDLLYLFFSKIGLITSLQRIIFRFYPYNGIGCNVYTFFRRPFIDFGYWGCIIVTLLCGIIIGYIYHKLKNQDLRLKHLTSLLIYSYFMNKVVMAFFDDYITTWISASNAVMTILFYIFCNFIFCSKFVIHKSKNTKKIRVAMSYSHNFPLITKKILK